MGTETVVVPLLTNATSRRELGGLALGNRSTRASVVGIGRAGVERVAGLLDTSSCRLLVSLGCAEAWTRIFIPATW